jgi:hypothetical protein
MCYAFAMAPITDFHFHNCLICGQRFISMEIISEAFTAHQTDHHDFFSADPEAGRY